MIAFRRLLALAGVLVAVSLITFSISHVIPGDPAQMMSGPRATEDQVEAVREDLGLNRPVQIQYGRYVQSLLNGDFGTSIVSGRPVADELQSRLAATTELMLPVVIISAVFGIFFGLVAAARKGGVFDNLLRGFAVAGISTPTFWLALVLLLLFYAQLGWLPPGGRLDPSLAPPPHFTGLYLVDSVIAGQGRVFLDAVAHLVLPVASLSLVALGVYVRVVRASMLEVLGQDYIRTAVASGLDRRRILTRHALPNALVPFVTLFGIELGHLLFGSVIVETIFAWPGLGSYVLNAILELDFPVIMAFTLLSSIAYVFANLAVDFVIMWLDPRVRGIG